MPAAWRHGVGMALAAAALLALGGIAPRLLSSTPPATPGVANPSQLSGTLTCVECELARRRPLPGLESMLPRAASPSSAAQHGRLHLRDDAGEFWELLPLGDSDGGGVGDIARLTADHGLAGRRATVFGIQEPDLHVLRLARFQVD